MWRQLRIAVLLLVLLFVGLNTYFDRVYSTDWDIPLRIGVYPINADASPAATRYIAALSPQDFTPLENFFDAEGRTYGMTMDRPVRFFLGKPIAELPPKLVARPSLPSAVLWSLRTRYWAWRAPEELPGAQPDVRLFVLYHDPAQHEVLPHSVGLQKGLYGIVNAFADRRADGMNQTVCAHELLHTLGATDKYHRHDSLPQHPHGFAEPNRQPLYPQAFAELMAGRIPRSSTEADIPTSLDQVLIGPLTAIEIGWKHR
jgi:hypothetical protein